MKRIQEPIGQYRTPGLSRLVFGILPSVVCGILAIIILWVFLKQNWSARHSDRVTLTSGERSGGYYRIARIIADATAKKQPWIDVDRSGGSQENLERIASDKDYQFGFIQSDTIAAIQHRRKGAGQEIELGNVRLVGSLYDEILYILIRKDSTISSIFDLDNKPVYVGNEQSGSSQMTDSLLTYFRVHVREQRIKHTSAAITALKEGRVEAVFIVRPIASPFIAQKLRDSQLKLLSLHMQTDDMSNSKSIDLAKPFIQAHPYYRYEYIYPWSFGEQQLDGVSTIKVSALLICKKTTSNIDVEYLTSLLFEHRLDMLLQSSEEDFRSVASIVSQLEEDPKSFQGILNYHPGARKFYDRQKPMWLERYAEPGSFLLSVILIIASIFGTLWQFRLRRRKLRIEQHYKKVIAACEKIYEDNTKNELLALRQDILSIRSKALRELTEDSLDADESFRIFQEFVRGALERIERNIEKCGTAQLPAKRLLETNPR